MLPEADPRQRLVTVRVSPGGTCRDAGEQAGGGRARTAVREAPRSTGALGELWWAHDTSELVRHHGASSVVAIHGPPRGQAGTWNSRHLWGSEGRSCPGAQGPLRSQGCVVKFPMALSVLVPAHGRRPPSAVTAVSRVPCFLLHVRSGARTVLPG